MPPLLYAFAAIRVIIGLAPFVAAEPLIRLLGFPASEDSATTRVFARLFGVRDIGLGAIIAWSVGRPEVWPAMILLNGLTDLGDLATFLFGMRGRPDLRFPLGVCAAIAGSAVVAWAVLAAVVLS